ncbi:heparinase II/III family protein [uncultured Tenacibaculum sp.]|uniref:heparinase II/III domain-containing protein n=1 Tax=uncultured Tenacibaculum sp. TaxID=174713 RepID=UPI002634C6C0|nr:heparinase II/III family protein [uncultured Tenacibaculum sp.]
MLRTIQIIPILLLLSFLSCKTNESQTKTDKNTTAHPNLMLTIDGVNSIKKNLKTTPLFDQTLEQTQNEVDAQIAKGIDIPIPKDMAGGYPHTQHKINYAVMQKAGLLFQILGDEKYAAYIKEMLMGYADLYPKLDRHPETRSYARGKIFWQCLNDANWLVYTSQAYDCIYNWLSKEDRSHLEENLFRPFADFLSVETPQFFNRIHNHSTWGCVAVGMIGLVMNDDELVNRALYGIKKDGISNEALDNDGGLIKSKDGKAGFLANLDSPFSPDGYYTEGPYYHRYALYPFLIFAQALQNKKPELKIFEYKNGVLLKSVDAILNLTDEDGDFFPLNDGQKGMSYYNSSLISAVDIAYFYGNQNKQLLSIAKAQNKVQLDETGMAVSLDIKEGVAEPFEKSSIELTDGANGDKGAIGILRGTYKNQKLTLVMKYSAHGLSHGHFDKLSFSLYENGEEVIQDYGLSRFVNVEQKNGGGYLKENKTWAKQTIAHNTITVNQTSQYKGKFKESSKNHSEKYLFNSSDKKVQVVSAIENNAYNNVGLQRTMVLVTDTNLAAPFVLDINKVKSKNNNTYDLPFYYFGQVIGTNLKLETSSQLNTLGDTNGYQHLWKEAEAKPLNQFTHFTWLNHNKFYSISSVSETNEDYILGRIGANDPNFNLRRDPVFIHRKQNKSNTLFVNVIESHGSYNAVLELAKQSKSTIENTSVIYDDKDYTAVKIVFTNKEQRVFIISNTNPSENTKHELTIKDKHYKWQGAYYFNN